MTGAGGAKCSRSAINAEARRPIDDRCAAAPARRGGSAICRPISQVSPVDLVGENACGNARGAPSRCCAGAIHWRAATRARRTHTYASADRSRGFRLRRAPRHGGNHVCTRGPLYRTRQSIAIICVVRRPWFPTHTTACGGRECLPGEGNLAHVREQTKRGWRYRQWTQPYIHREAPPMPPPLPPTPRATYAHAVHT